MNYFKSIAELAIPPKTEAPADSDFEETLTAGTAALLASSTASTELEPAKKEVTKVKKPLPRLKLEANIKEFRVAIIEAVDEPQPQALTLKVGSTSSSVCSFLCLEFIEFDCIRCQLMPTFN